MAVKNRPHKKPIKPGKNNSTGPKFDERLMPQVLDEVARLRRMGFTQIKISERLFETFNVKVSQPMVVSYEKKVIEQYRQSTVEERALLVEEKCAALRDVMKEAWDAYERSKSDAEKHVKETFEEQDCPACKGEGMKTSKKGNDVECFKCGGSGKYQQPNKNIDTVEGRLPGAEYLNIIPRAHQQESELRGLKPVANQLIQNNISQTNTMVASPQDIASLILGMRDRPDDVEAKLKGIEDLPSANAKDGDASSNS